MPSVQNTPSANSSSPQLQSTISSFTSLTDPIAINDALIVLNHALQGTNASNVTGQILGSIPLSHFFQLLQADHGDDTEFMIERVCNVLELILKDQPFNSLIQDPFLSGALLQSLNSPSPKIHALGLTQIDKLSNADISIMRSTLESDIFKATVEGIASENISIAERSKQSFLKICNTEERLAAIINFDASFCLIRDLANSKNSVVRMRMIEALTGLAGRSPGFLDVLQKTDLLDSLKDGLSSEDILTRFNIIEILSEFGTTATGSDFLDQAGILSRIAEVVENEADQDSLGVNAITKLYGKLGASGEVDFISLDMKYRILTQLEKLMVGDDDFEPEESLKVESMASFGLIGGNVHNIEWISQSHCVQTFIDLLASLSRDLKVAWYHSLAQILACSQSPSVETQNTVAELYNNFERPGQSPFIARLLVSAKSQTTELAMSALAVMIPLARYSFGVQQIGSQPDALTFLLDRNAESSHAQKVAKYEVIEAMLKTVGEVKRTSNRALLTPEQISRLELFHRQGPFYQRATATVAIQDIAA
ncbi:26S proteasome non-ATPase regulatory subunit 5 [Mortierella sp. AM989]|nr:26S proteasome non-ATPase regulatory subunit 5 [Mortierella sp. AM989]